MAALLDQFSPTESELLGLFPVLPAVRIGTLSQDKL
jgi:hypothetical protein